MKTHRSKTIALLLLTVLIAVTAFPLFSSSSAGSKPVIDPHRVLYSTDPSNLDAPGQHEALIWQVFASHEMGVNADCVIGGRQTISTRVPQFAADQARTSAPQGITVEPASAKTLRVSWQPTAGAFAYEVFKRKVGTAGQRQFAGAPLHTYFDGDASTNGWSHVTYVANGSTSYEDAGAIAEFFGPNTSQYHQQTILPGGYGAG